MTLPASVATGTITGTWIDSDGDPCTGCVTFTPSVFGLRVTVDDTVVHLHRTVATLDAAGSISQTLVATDNDGVTPTDWTWIVDVELDDGAGYRAGAPIGIALPAGQTVDLSAA